MKTRRKRRRKRIDKPAITSAEIIVMELLKRGMTHKEIGKKLYRSTKTIDSHVQNIQRKMKVNKETAMLWQYGLRKFGNYDFD